MLDEAGQDTDYEDENDSEVEDHVEVREKNTDTEQEGDSESELEDERGTYLGKDSRESIHILYFHKIILTKKLKEDFFWKSCRMNSLTRS